MPQRADLLESEDIKMKNCALIASEIRYSVADKTGAYKVTFKGEEKLENATVVSSGELALLNGKNVSAVYVDGAGSYEITPAENKGELSGKIAVVTGSAQGFGLGIADYLASKGACIVVADMNGDGAKAAASAIEEKHGVSAVAVTTDVSNEESVKNLAETAALTFGGIDIFVNNAGIVRAGSLDEMTLANFQLVENVNYNAYFLCAKYASKIMKAQRKANDEVMFDIIEINSKSGLEGSNKNFAYAGSKFGGIGLTQSFAMELAPYGIKVNAICPGNFLDGPLWSDPEKGLFVQYLNAGKVPGAKTVADVRKFYEAKVPLGRGCRTEDVCLAISYIIAQKYETGQAIPVTGGQVMLK